MDGMSVLSQIVEPSALEHPATGAQQEKPRWSRDAFLIEYSGLSAWPNQGGRINDCPNNTWRALRVFGNDTNMLFAQLTSVDDYYYNTPNWHELYNLDRDPHQLTNLWDGLPHTQQDALIARVAKAHSCSGVTCRTL